MSAITLDVRQRALAAAAPKQLGRVAELVGLHLRVTGLQAAIGDLLEVGGPQPVLVEVAACGSQGLVCLPMGATSGLTVGAHVRHTGGPLRIHVGDELRGRVLDGLGRPVVGGPSLHDLPLVEVDQQAPPALSRPRVGPQAGTGVGAVDALVP